MSERSKEPSATGTDHDRSASVSRLPDRVFGDADITRILQTAADLQERSDSFSATSGHGLTIEDLRQIAREAGIDPQFVDIAVAQGHGPIGGGGGALLGGRNRWRFHSEVPGGVSEEDRGRLVQAVRSVMDEDGEVAEVYGRLEWRHDDSLGPVTVGVAPKGDAIEIDVSANKSGEAGLLFLVGVPLGGLAGGAAVAGLLGLVGTAAAPVVAATMAGVSYGALRLAWSMRSSWWERRLQSKIDELSSTVQAIATPSADSKDDDF